MFYGTFSALNDPTDPNDHFPDPTQVTFQRNVLVDGVPKMNVDLKNPGGNITGLGAPSTSIDPYFFSVPAVPEPGTWLLLATGLFGAGWCLFRRKGGCGATTP
jgi:PEP-CTERM motif